MLPLFLRRSAVAIAIAAIVPLVALAGLPAPASGPTSHASPPSGERSIAPSGGGNSAVAAGPPALPTGGAPDERSARAEVLSELAKAHVPDRFAFLPNFGLAPPRPGSVATPGYRYSPAPVGVAAYGVNNTTGTPTAALLNTASFEGSTTFDQLSAFYLDDDSPWYVGEQLNAVLSNVTLFGNDSYAFWTQNVVEYSAQDGLLQFIDNIWNFSSPATRISSNVFNSTGPNGSLLAPTFYYGLGPVINISMPFTLNLYLNATTTPVGGFP
ncbi:MAG TPA: thermopsin family protease, partial [Thermoplasmata archaeon]|nr:thermopsin family protease [Thermoplasmata archaeon]